jgi:SAM-dependent methyltransferase
MVQTNGFAWTLLVVVYAACRMFDKDLRLPFLDRRMRAVEKRRGVPGMGAPEIQVLIWDSWDWDADGGEKWTESKGWKDSVIREVLRRCIEICRERFGHLDHVTFFVTSGSDLSFIDDDQIDVVWSFDVFVHLAVPDIEAYVREFARVLRPEGQAIIHHAAGGGVQGGWRSAMTTEEFLAMRAGFIVVEQFDSWGASGEYVLSTHQDMISVIRKPPTDRDDRRM